MNIVSNIFIYFIILMLQPQQIWQIDRVFKVELAYSRQGLGHMQ